MKRKPWQHVSVTRSDANVAILKRMYKANATLEEIGKAIGVSRPSVSRMIKALDLPHRAPPPRYMAPKPVREPKPPRIVQSRPEPSPGPLTGSFRMPLDFAKAPVRFINVDRTAAPLDERIIAELKVRPLSTMSLASIVGVRESSVCQALSALRYEGKVAMVADKGPRHSEWGVGA